MEDTEAVKEAVETVDGIYKVSYNNEIIDAVAAISDIGMLVMLVIGAVMMVISLFILSNTIKLSVYSNKREIYIMKYMGATPRFIRTPFVISGILMGIASAITSWIVLSIAYLVLYRYVPHFLLETHTFGLVSYKTIWYIILGANLLIGTILGGIGSSIAVRKHQSEFRASTLILKEERQKNKEEKEAKKISDETLKKAQKLKEEEEKIRAKIQKKQSQKDKEQKKEIKPESKEEMGLDEAKKARKEVRRNVKK